MKQMRSAGGWAAIKYTLRMANRVGWGRLWKAMQAKNACKTCALGMGGQRGGMRNEAGHWPEVCKKSLQAMVADMQAGLTPDFFQRYSHCRAADSLAARTGILRPLDPAALCRTRRYALSRHRLGRSPRSAWRTAARQAAADESFFYASGRSSNEAGFLLQLFGTAATARITSTTAPIIAIRPAASGLGRSLGTGTATRHAGGCRTRRSVLPDRRQSGVESSAADADPDDDAPARRTSHRHQSGQGTGPRQLQRPVGRAESAVRLEDRQPVRAAAHRRRHRPA